jgi:hypothetical protein
MEFSTDPLVVDWTGKKFSTACRQHRGYVGSTNIQAALDKILSMALKSHVKKDQMINSLIIVSDMQFDQYTEDPDQNTFFSGGTACTGTERTVIEKCMSEWEAAGYDRPSIVFWNVAGYAGQPATCQTPNTALVSGFSPSIMKAVLEEEELDAMSILRRAIKKYKVTAPVSQ